MQSECVYSYPTNAAGERGALVDFNSLQMFAQSSHSRCVDFAYQRKVPCICWISWFVQNNAAERDKISRHRL